MSMETLRTEAERHRDSIDAAEQRLTEALECQETANREVKAARLALEEARMAGAGTLAAWKIASAEPRP